MAGRRPIGYEDGLPKWNVKFEEGASGPLFSLDGMPGIKEAEVRLHGMGCDEVVVVGQQLSDFAFTLYCRARAYQRDLAESVSRNDKCETEEE